MKKRKKIEEPVEETAAGQEEQSGGEVVVSRKKKLAKRITGLIFDAALLALAIFIVVKVATCFVVGYSFDYELKDDGTYSVTAVFNPNSKAKKITFPPSTTVKPLRKSVKIIITAESPTYR